MNKYHIYIVLIFVAIASCTVPKFTQGKAGLADDEKTINIKQYKSSVARGTSDMYVVFTQKTKDYFQQNTKLEVVDDFADIELQCEIRKYVITHQAPVAGETAALNKLEITVSATYISNKHLDDKEKNFEKKDFRGFTTFSSSADFNSIEADLIDEISDQIIVNIFSSTAGNW